MAGKNSGTKATASNAEATKAASEDTAAAAAQSETGATGTYGSEAVSTDSGSKDAGTYTVKAGDSLESIAAENDTTPAELMRLNPDYANTGNNFVYEGDTLRLK